jgi:membrane protein
MEMTLVGSATAVARWIIASLYAANFGNFNRTVIGFMVWIRISISAMLFGAEIDTELEHARALTLK